MKETGVRRYVVACAIGGGISLLVFVWLLWSAPGGFLDPTPYGMGSFYDEQARALFDGHWDASAESFFIERITLDGRYYMYFGPWPSVLRMPVLLFTSELDGRLTRPSLVLAYVVLLLAVSRLLWQIRSLGRKSAPSRREQCCIAGFLVAVGGGTALVFLSANVWVYDEALLWGTAWAIWSMSFTLAYIVRPGRSSLVLAAAATGLAILSRVTCGLIGVTVLGSCFAVQFLTSRRQARLRAVGASAARLGGLEDRLAGRGPWSTAAAAAAPVTAFMVVNWLKFGSLLSVPFDQQDLVNQADPQRLAVLARNGPDLSALDEIPTNLLNYFRPNGISVERLFPFVDFSRDVAVIGNPVRDIEQAYASITPTSTLLLALALIGLGVVFVRRVGRSAGLDEARVLRVIAIATGLAVVPTLMFASVAQRYTVDFVPAMVLLGAVGMYAAATWLRGRAALRRGAVVGVAVLLIANVWTHLALTRNTQLAYQLTAPAVRSQYVQDRIDWTRRLGLRPGARLVEHGTADELPAEPIGTFLILGDCEQLLLSNGAGWLELDFGEPEEVCDALGSSAGGN